MVGEMVARNELIVLNQGGDFTFRRGAGGSIIDLTIAAPRLASRMSDWSVLEVITLSDHRCIEFTLEQRCQAMDKGRGGNEGAPPGTEDDSAGKDFANTSKKPGSSMSLVGSALLGRSKLLCAR